MSNSLFCCATPRNATGGVLEWVNRTTIHPFCGLAIDIPESRSLTNGVRHQAPSSRDSPARASYLSDCSLSFARYAL